MGISNDTITRLELDDARRPEDRTILLLGEALAATDEESRSARSRRHAASSTSTPRASPLRGATWSSPSAPEHALRE